MQQVLLFSTILFNIRHFEKHFQNIHWPCLNIQLSHGLWIYFLYSHAKIKTVHKISQFSCFHYNLANFHANVKPIQNILYIFYSTALKAIQYENLPKLFILNGNKRPIRYEFLKSMKPRHWFST